MAKPTIGKIGAGHIGSQVARLAISCGHPVVISNSRAPDALAALVGELGPAARAATAADAATSGDIVVVSIALKNYRDVPVGPLAGKIVIDTNNYYPQRDGQIPELDNESTTTSELLQAHLPTSKVVKAFNHIYAAELTTHGQPAGSVNRRALVIAGDDAGAKARRGCPCVRKVRCTPRVYGVCDTDTMKRLASFVGGSFGSTLRRRALRRKRGDQPWSMVPSTCTRKKARCES